MIKAVQKDYLSAIKIFAEFEYSISFSSEIYGIIWKQHNCTTFSIKWQYTTSKKCKQKYCGAFVIIYQIFRNICFILVF